MGIKNKKQIITEEEIRRRFEEIVNKKLNNHFISTGDLIRFKDACIEFGKQEARKELTRENIKGFKDAQRYESGFLKSLFRIYKGELYFQSDSINRIKQRIKQLEGVKRK